MAKPTFREETRAVMAKADETLVASLLRGALDLHVHSGPSTMPRQLDHLQAVEEAAAAGMAAVLFKDHHYSVAPFLPIIERLTEGSGVRSYACLVLNNAVGGLNPYAVDFALKSGAKLIMMPTAHSANHIRSTHRKVKLASRIQLKKPYAVHVVDQYGELLDPLKEILDMIAGHDAVLASGHLHIAEIWKLFEEARARGVKRLMVNHPTYDIHCTYADIAELVSMGAVIEQSACLFIDSRFNVYEPEELKRQIDAAGVDATSFGSDLGQVDCPTPVEGIRQAIRLCLGLGYAVEDVRKMVRDNPARVIGLHE